MGKPNYKIEFNEKVSKLGLYSNAFRILEDEETPSDCFIDFLVASPTNKKAFVTTRVRVRKEFLYEMVSYLMKNFGINVIGNPIKGEI